MKKFVLMALLVVGTQSAMAANYNCEISTKEAANQDSKVQAQFAIDTEAGKPVSAKTDGGLEGVCFPFNTPDVSLLSCGFGGPDGAIAASVIETGSPSLYLQLMPGAQTKGYTTLSCKLQK